MSDRVNNEIRSACNVIIEHGNLNAKETQFMERWINDADPSTFIDKNCEDPVFLGLSIRLAKILGEEEKTQ